MTHIGKSFEAIKDDFWKRAVPVSEQILIGISMREIALFAEGRNHRLIVGALAQNLAEGHGFSPTMNWRNFAHGFGRVAQDSWGEM